jgi:thermitase
MAVGQIMMDNPDPIHEVIQWNGTEVFKGEVLVQFKSLKQPQAARFALHQQNGTELIDVIAPRLDLVRFKNKSLDEVLDSYYQNPNVDFAEPNYAYRHHMTPNDPKWSSQWGPKKISCADAWNCTTGDPSAVVAIIDSGVDMDHPDLMAHYAWGKDYYSGDNNPNDTFGHGTHTTGTAAAETNNAVGIAGVACHCKYAAYRAGNYYLSNSAIVSSINDAVSKGALVISMSFGGGASTSIKNALTNAYNAGVVNVASAGNAGNTSKNYPAAYSNVIAVASSTQSDGRSSFSTYGYWVDVAAPGSNILSTYNNGKYTNMSGTSMAAPHVAGMAVILYSMLGGGRTKANADLVRSAIQDSAVDVGTWVIHGRVDLEAAMFLIAPPAPPTVANIQPSEVKAFLGGTITITGDNFFGVTEVNSGGVLLTGSDFTVEDENTITYIAPTATQLGVMEVTVTNTSGTSNPGTFNCVETDPPALSAGLFAGGGQDFTWAYGGGASDLFFLLVSTSNTTANYKGFPVLVTYVILQSGQLDVAGIGELTVQVPTGLGGTQFYSQVFTLDDQNSNFGGASTVKQTLIIN